jgi:2-polyprenyl-3-methyl-5-hydroxy-6-metoxy-1,4-benzoquinol methylase
MARNVHVINVCDSFKKKLNRMVFNSSYFEPYYDDLKREKTYVDEIHWIEESVSLKDKDVLDYGCGIGRMMKKLKSFGANVYGCDVSEFAIRHCKSNGLEARLIVQEDIPFDEKFDIVILRGVFQHLSSPNVTISKLEKLIRPNGFIVILATPNIESFCYRRLGILPTLSKDIVMNLPSRSSIRHSLEIHNFKVTKVAFPYWRSSYSRPALDFFWFLVLILKFKKGIPPALPGNVIQVMGQKC